MRAAQTRSASSTAGGSPPRRAGGGAQCSSPDDVFKLDAAAVAAVLVTNREALRLSGAVVGGAHDLRDARNAVYHLSPRADLGRREALTHLDRLSAFCRQMGSPAPRIDEFWDAVDAGVRAGPGGGEDAEPDAGEGHESRPAEPAPENGSGGEAAGSGAPATTLKGGPCEAGAPGPWPPARDYYEIPRDEREALDEFLRRQTRVRRWGGDVVLLTDPSQRLQEPSGMTLVVVHPSVTEGLIRCSRDDSIPDNPVYLGYAFAGRSVVRVTNSYRAMVRDEWVDVEPGSVFQPGSPCCRERSYKESLAGLLSGLCDGVPPDKRSDIAFLIPNHRTVPEHVKGIGDTLWAVPGLPEEVERSLAAIGDLKELKGFDRTGRPDMDGLTDEEVEEQVAADMAKARTIADRWISRAYGQIWCRGISEIKGVMEAGGFKRVDYGGYSGYASGEGGYSMLIDDAVLALIDGRRLELGVYAGGWTADSLQRALQEMYWSRGIDRVGADELWAWFSRSAFPEYPCKGVGAPQKAARRRATGVTRRRSSPPKPRKQQTAQGINGVSYDDSRPTEDYLREVFRLALGNAVAKGYVSFRKGDGKSSKIVTLAEINRQGLEILDDGIVVRRQR